MNPGRDYDGFRRQVPESVTPMLDSIRKFCLGLDGSVIEDVRMHRVVFCRSISFRWFADVAPEDHGVTIKLQRGRREPPEILRLEENQEIDFDAIRRAFDNVR